MTRALIPWLVLGAATCSARREDRPASQIDPEAAVNHPDPPPPVPLCTSLADLGRYEGSPVRVQGTFRFPTEKAFARNKLSLADGTVVVLSRPEDPAVAAPLVEANHGARMTIRGLIFIKEIPPQYRIIGRTPDPYLLDIESVELDP